MSEMHKPILGQGKKGEEMTWREAQEKNLRPVPTEAIVWLVVLLILTIKF